MQHFEKHTLPGYDLHLSRGPNHLQVLKICYVCRKGFCKRKGRAKALEVANAPGRWVCLKCAKAHPEQIINPEFIMSKIAT